MLNVETTPWLQHITCSASETGDRCLAFSISFSFSKLATFALATGQSIHYSSTVCLYDVLQLRSHNMCWQRRVTSWRRQWVGNMRRYQTDGTKSASNSRHAPKRAHLGPKSISSWWSIKRWFSDASLCTKRGCKRDCDSVVWCLSYVTHMSLLLWILQGVWSSFQFKGHLTKSHVRKQTISKYNKLGTLNFHHVEINTFPPFILSLNHSNVLHKNSNVHNHNAKLRNQ